ncbi:hypothetical protein [uncultured Sphingomonas sp.]|uniref:hypothetical protein n=1 Tax=uncultured Sphingomonas sp. TaxID=158754 RepID=UPI0035CC1AF8
MLARLILLLLAMAFAAPAATAACHARVGTLHAAEPSHHGSAPVERDDGIAPATACIGCVPPSDWTPGRIAASVPVPIVPVSARTHALTIGRGTPPDLRPPRMR